MVKSGQVWSGVFVSLDATGALSAATTGPAGVLYVDGTANGAAVTITGSNPYKWTVTLPALTAGDCVSMYITATIATIATASVVAEDVADTVALSDVNTALATVDGIVDALALVAPDNKPTVAATGEASANVTLWAGDGVNDLNGGNVPADVVSSIGQALSQRLIEVSDTVIANVRGVQPTGNTALPYPVATAAATSGNQIALLTSVSTNLAGWSILVLSGTYQYYSAVVDSVPTSTTLVMDRVLPNISYGTSLVFLPPGGATIDGQDIADALLLAPVGVAADGSAMAELAAILEDTGTTLPALIVPNVGARTVVITVNDGTDPLENAKVRLTEGINTVVETTDVNGNVTFNRDDATYLVAITKAGYTFSGTSLVVNGDETQTYSMTTVSFAVSDPGQATGWVYCYDNEGNVEAGVSISVQLTATPETDSYAFDTVVRVVLSEADGLAEFTGLWIGATYRARRFNGPWYSFVVPDVLTFALPVLLGR